MYLFNPLQFKDFGASFESGKQFTVRYQKNSRIRGLFNTMFVPLGPNCSSRVGLENFIDWCKNKRLTKIIIELPYIPESRRKEVRKVFIENNFKLKDYKIHDEETLFVKNGEYEVDSDTSYSIRYSLKRTNLRFSIDENSKDLIDDAYKVYVESADRIGYEPKKKKVFGRILEEGLLGVAYCNKEDIPVGFILGHFFTIEGCKYCYIVLSGTNAKGRKYKVGYGLYDKLINTCFQEFQIDVVDQGGAGRNANYSYLEFKKKFGGDFVKLGGRFEKFLII